MVWDLGRKRPRPHTLAVISLHMKLSIQTELRRQVLIIFVGILVAWLLAGFLMLVGIVVSTLLTGNPPSGANLREAFAYMADQHWWMTLHLLMPNLFGLAVAAPFLNRSRRRDYFDWAMIAPMTAFLVGGAQWGYHYFGSVFNDNEFLLTFAPWRLNFWLFSFVTGSIVAIIYSLANALVSRVFFRSEITIAPSGAPEAGAH